MSDTTVQIASAEVDRSTIVPVGEGVWFGWRTAENGIQRHPMLGTIRRGVWWVDGVDKVVSLATGTGLHGWGGVDFETYVFLPKGVDLDVCCHDSFEAAQTCALSFFANGHWCQGWGDG